MNIAVNAILKAMKLLLKYFYFILFLCLNYFCSFSQNALNYGFQKNLDNYSFLFNLNYTINSSWGQFEINQNYTGNSNAYIKNYFRDDENINFTYKKNIFDNFNLISVSNYLSNSDKRSIINIYQRTNSSLGLEYSNSQFSVNSTYGIEKNKHQYFDSYGKIVNIRYNINQLDFDEFSVSTEGLGELLNLEDGRNNRDVLLSVNLFKTYDENNHFKIISNYKQNKRDFGYLIFQTSPAIETRQEERLQNQLLIAYSITNFFTQSLSLSWERSSIMRFFNHPLQDNNYSFTNRKFEIDNISVSLDNNFNYSLIKQNFSFFLLRRAENNYLENKFNLNNPEFSTLINFEKQKDNINTNFRFSSVTFFEISPKNTLGVNYSSSITRYDTPSKFNYDDRDELSLSSSLLYSYLISNNSKLNLNFDVSATHLVFLKSQRSALNNWNRIIRFSPSFEHYSRYFQIKPQFEVIANYTVYDFDKLPNSSKSLSFRQISYSDSIKLFFSNTHFAESKIVYKYNERGILYWGSFAELPQLAYSELFANFILYTKFLNENSKIGIGGRGYSLTQRKLNRLSQLSSSNISQKSFGPEINTSIQFNNKLFVNISGWYEFRYYKGDKIKPVVNFFLQTNYFL